MRSKAARFTQEWPFCLTVSRPMSTLSSVRGPILTCRCPGGVARGELVEIRAADLRFTAEETATFLNDVTGLGLSEENVELLEHRTEGWIAALQLAALSLEGRDDPSGFIARFAGNDKYIVDYLVDEVLAHQTPEVREFLIQSAVLDRLTGPLCDAVTGGDDGHDVLVALERANLFLFPLDDHREWYRYHHLFADVLRGRLLQSPSEDVALLHQRASRWHETHGAVEDSVRHALAAGDFDRASNLMEAALPSMRRLRQDSVLLGWLAELPDDAVRRSPVLSVFYGWSLMLTGDLEGVEARLDDAAQALANATREARSKWTDTEELRTLPATIAVYRAALAQAKGQVAETSVHAQQALDLAAPEDHLARGAATAFMGQAAWATGDVRAAVRTFSDCCRESPRSWQRGGCVEQHGRARRHVALRRPIQPGPSALRGVPAPRRGQEVPPSRRRPRCCMSA